MPKHIGIIAVSPEGSALCYRSIMNLCAERPGPKPSVTLHSRPFAAYLDAIHKQDWTAVGMLLQESALALAAAGAEFCVLPDNVAVYAAPLAEAKSPIPWLSMIDLVADAVTNDHRVSVGLLGTKAVSYGSIYQAILGLRGVKVVAPPEAEADVIDRIIYDELVYGRVMPRSRECLLHSIEALAARGCDGVIIGCTELPLLLNGVGSPLPFYDAVGLLSTAAVDRSLAL
ncbi:MAG: amino acid racemase [Phycisphaerales bacterium]|nr:amino acid racemase [Phycisphaerales bacterium]